MKSRIARILMAVFSAGWLFPMWMATYSYLKFVGEDLPTLSRNQVPHNSFPYMAFASNVMTWAFLWLGAVIVFWAYWLLKPNKTDARA